MAKITTPYEFLVRMNKDGTIAGAHVKFLDTHTDDVTKAFISHTEGDAQPVSVAGSVGFPIATILSAIQSAALATVEIENAKAATSNTACAAAKLERDAAVTALAAEKTAHQQTIAAKNAELAALKAVVA